MSNNKFTLSYSNEDDRAYGLAGMAVTIASLDAADRISEVWLDADGPMVTFSNAYYFSGSPSVSPKATWENMIKNFHLTASMVIGNVMARSVVRTGMRVPDDVMEEIKKMIVEEGRDSCELEQDEVEAMIARAVNRANRIFLNPRVHPLLRDLVSVISRKRRLSGRELEDELAYLRF